MTADLLYRRGRTAVGDGRSRKMTGEDTIVREDGPLRFIKSMIAGSSEKSDSERTAHETAHDEMQQLVAMGQRPRPYVLDLAMQIRYRLGCGGANFPGASELYQAADLIEMWAAACNEDR